MTSALKKIEYILVSELLQPTVICSPSGIQLDLQDGSQLYTFTHNIDGQPEARERFVKLLNESGLEHRLGPKIEYIAGNTPYPDMSLQTGVYCRDPRIA